MVKNERFIYNGYILISMIPPVEALIEPLTDLMDREAIRSYILPRVLPAEDQRDDVLVGLKGMIIHHAYQSEEVRRKLHGAGLVFSEYKAPLSDEAHFHTPETNTIHVVNPRDPERLIREINLFAALKELLESPLTARVSYFNDDPSKANDRFKEFAANLVDDALDERVMSEIGKRGLLNIVMCPFEAFSLDNTDVLKEGNGEYLKYKVLHLGDEVVLLLDYIFAQQAEDVLDRIYMKIGSTTPGVCVNLFHTGKNGAMNTLGESEISPGDICIATGFLDERKLIACGDERIHSFRNELHDDQEYGAFFAEAVGRPIHYGITVNTRPVLNQKRVFLEEARKKGGRFLDMEWGRLSRAGMVSKPGLGWIREFFAGVDVDLPLEGRTLANSDYDRDQLRPIADAYKELIRMQK